jgi:hypothetical protein
MSLGNVRESLPRSGSYDTSEVNEVPRYNQNKFVDFHLFLFRPVLRALPLPSLPSMGLRENSQIISNRIGSHLLNS